MLNYDSIYELITEANHASLPISEIIFQDQVQQLESPPDQIYKEMLHRLQVMQHAVDAGVNPDLRSASGLTGGDGGRMFHYSKTGGICGSFFTGAITKAIAVAEYNASMGKIVAAPTAGSCGILPAAILSFMEKKHLSEKTAVMALFTAGGIGLVIAKNATVSGAEGGCQAECGSAAAMAAGALTEMAGGTPDMVAHACAIALKNELGLVCDPVAGLVEVPCIKRNAAGVSIALMAAEMALAGIKSKIPVDEVILSMKEVGASIPCSLRETALGGLASTPTGLKYKKEIFGTD